MSLIKPTLFRKLLLKYHPLAITTIRNEGHWNKDYKPGPYPKSMKEFEKAAKKYNLAVEEYKPYPDDGNGLGDYPDLPVISAHEKDPFYPYDFPEHKRNFGEPLHAYENLIGEDRLSPNHRYRYSPLVLHLQFIGVMGLSVFLYWVGEKAKFFLYLCPKQYPNTGEKHYTFELKDK